MLNNVFAFLTLLHLTIADPQNLCLPLSQVANQQVSPPGLSQGPPGKAGPVGQPGAKGERGVAGPPSQCNCDDNRIIRHLQEEVRMLNEKVQKLMNDTERNNDAARQCNVPSPPQFGTVSPRVPTIAVRGTLTYQCNDGYQIAGRNTNRLVVTCQNGGTWSQGTPVCQRVGNCEAGLKDGRILDNQITARDFNNANWAPHFARLDRELPNRSGGTWLPKNPYPNAWIQVDFRTPTRIVGIITQGHSQAWWVSGFKISYGNSPSNLQVIRQSGTDKVFQANPADGAAHVTNKFPTPVTGRYFRLILVSYNAASPTLRMEYLTC